MYLGGPADECHRRHTLELPRQQYFAAAGLLTAHVHRPGTCMCAKVPHMTTATLYDKVKPLKTAQKGSQCVRLSETEQRVTSGGASLQVN